MILLFVCNFFNFSFVNVKSLCDIEGELVLEIYVDDVQVCGIVSGQMVCIFNDWGEYCCKVKVLLCVCFGVVNGLGIWWCKFGLVGINVNQVISQWLIDLGCGLVFYDCLVEVVGVVIGF